MIDVSDYKEFMRISSFPKFDIEYYNIDISQEYYYGARAEYDVNTKTHTLMMPKNYEVFRYMIFHELTHIWDMESLATGEKNHDFCLTGYMEYHASQVELMFIIGATSIKDTPSFSMNKTFEPLGRPVEQYLKNKLDIAQRLMSNDNKKTRLDGLGAFFNFLGLKSVCSMFTSDFEENYSYQGIIEKISSFLFMEIIRTYSGWIDDYEKAVAIYSHFVKAIM